MIISIHISQAPVRTSPLSSAATKLQYPVHTCISPFPAFLVASSLSPELQASLHSTPYNSSLFSFSDQKLKFNDEIRKIQSSTSLFRGSVISAASTGQMCKGCVRQVRGVYESVRSRVLICVFHHSLAFRKGFGRENGADESLERGGTNEHSGQHSLHLHR